MKRILELLAELHELKEQLKEAVDDLKLVVSKSESTLTLHLLHIPASQRGFGHGNYIMSELAVFCDRHNLLFTLLPVEDYGTPLTVLEAFYGKHGFQRDGKHSMLRTPLYWEEYLACA